MAHRGWWAAASRGLAELSVGTWRRTVIAAALLVALFGLALGVASAAGPMRYASFPGHPYPPSGFYRNPFSTDPGDLVKAADAGRVRADFQRDGQIELDAFANGDPAPLTQADAGGRLDALRLLIAQNNSVGVAQRYENHPESIVVGRHPTPAGSSTTWYVEEKGTASLSDVARVNGQVLRTRRYRFDGRFWLVRAGDRYVITDAAIANEPLAGG